jgi:hypothetical protein
MVSPPPLLCIEISRFSLPRAAPPSLLLTLSSPGGGAPLPLLPLPTWPAAAEALCADVPVRAHALPHSPYMPRPPPCVWPPYRPLPCHGERRRRGRIWNFCEKTLGKFEVVRKKLVQFKTVITFAF